MKCIQAREHSHTDWQRCIKKNVKMNSISDHNSNNWHFMRCKPWFSMVLQNKDPSSLGSSTWMIFCPYYRKCYSRDAAVLVADTADMQNSLFRYWACTPHLASLRNLLVCSFITSFPLSSSFKLHSSSQVFFCWIFTGHLSLFSKFALLFSKRSRYHHSPNL